MNDRDSQSARDAGTTIALLCLAVASFLLVLLAAMVLPQVLGIVLVVGLFLGVVALHYLVWGRWLSMTVDSDADESSREESRRVPPGEE